MPRRLHSELLDPGRVRFWLEAEFQGPRRSRHIKATALLAEKLRFVDWDLFRFTHSHKAGMDSGIKYWVLFGH